MAASAAAWLATRAIDAATLRAGAAPAHDALAKGFSSAEDTNASIVGGNASFDGVVLHRETLDVDATQCQRVLGLQSFGEARDAPADGVPLVEVGLSLLVELASEHRKRAVVRASPTVVIDDGVAQHPVEPRHASWRTSSAVSRWPTRLSRNERNARRFSTSTEAISLLGGSSATLPVASLLRSCIRSSRHREQGLYAPPGSVTTPMFVRTDIPARRRSWHESSPTQRFRERDHVGPRTHAPKRARRGVRSS